MKKRVAAAAFAVITVLMLCVSAFAENGEQPIEGKVYEDSVMQGETAPGNEKKVTPRKQSVSARGIDVSVHQGTIDWEKVKDNVDFAILRCGYGINETQYDDRQWKRNADECTRLGIPFGVYLYSYAETDAEARSEAEHALRLLQGYSPSLPVYLDLEDEKYIAPNCTNAQILSHATIFCEAMEAAGYRAGVYANRYWWTTKLTSSEYDKWDRWIAIYGPTDSPGYSKSYSCWQYTSSGSVSGISGNVDMDYWYGTLPTGVCSHSYVLSSTTAPGCLSGGTLHYTCSICGATKMQEIAALGHDYGEWTVVTEPTCVTDGVQKSTCRRCSAEKQLLMPASGVHVWDDGTVITPASCTEDGKMQYTCTQCDETRQEPIVCTGHTYTDGKCSTCGATDPGLVPGDLNGDGVRSSADVVLLARAMAKQTELTALQKAAADLNGDNVVTSADVVLLARQIAGIKP